MPTVTYSLDIARTLLKKHPMLSEFVLSEADEAVTFAVPRDLPSMRLPRRGLGDWLAALLHRLGFRRYSGCGCGARQQWLNNL